ncbi:S-layer homology domain-containing protein [Paenibacillus turpanensis]|uniref:S-layer homology domain-containing protein n=1 Tax=Paenibacillus turpanensis TaxID=2689078 RepID=UPI0014074E20|nr:S-layer homology domain-containing protein [Paenibacillus turpanensis]
MDKLTFSKESVCKLMTALAVLLVGTSAQVPASAQVQQKLSFTDTANHWVSLQGMLDHAVQEGYVSGFPDGSFQPDAQVTKAQFLKMVVEATKTKRTATTGGSAWYSQYVDAAVAAGFHRDHDFGVDKMDEPLSRIEMARIAVRATDRQFDDPAVTMDDDSFMYNAAKKGLIRGLDRGELAPEGLSTRAQAVTVIERILKVNMGETLDVDKYAVGNAELALKRTNIFTVIPEYFGGPQFKPWDVKKMTIETPDGLYGARIKRVVAIDMEDPNDPNRYMLGDLSNLRWDNGMDKEYRPFVKDYPKSYIVILETELLYNKDNSKYGNLVSATFLGIQRPDGLSMREQKKLNSIARVGLGDPNKSTWIIPKENLKTSSTISIALAAAAIPPNSNYSQNIVTVRVPNVEW